MTEKPLVSIIVPIYNAQDHIARCVESIRRHFQAQMPQGIG